MMRYGSVSSGIECAALAWAPLGWLPAFLAEIDPFASTVLHHHHSSGRPKHMPSPDAEGLSEKERRKRRVAIKAVAGLPDQANGAPNHGDMTTYEEWPDADIDVLVGGTPCQSYSLAGLRKGLDDPRGDLTLTYAAIARRFRPRWLVWENVAGVLSHDRGRSFASLLGLLSGRVVEVPSGGWKSAGVIEGYSRAYGIAWRVLDTQFVRVDGFGRAIPQRRRRVFVVGFAGDWRRAAAVLLERESMSGSVAPRRNTTEDLAGTLAGGARSRGGYSHDDIPIIGEAFGGNRQSGSIDVATALTSHGGPAGRIDFESETFVTDVAPTLDASYGRLQGQSGQDANHGHSHLVAGTILRDSFTGGMGGRPEGAAAGHLVIGSNWGVRRLTPRECCRLQGIPDDYFDEVVWRRKSPPPDGPIYKTLGNGFSINVVRWIGRRIEMVEQIEEAA